ncbi:peptide-binding protein [Spirochaetia bacterium]|nr:peptide-binding protein [Spirochaetia bacterium]
MAKKQCSKGHIYDSAIYGDNCPFCPAANGGGETVVVGGNTSSFEGETQVIQEARTQIAGTQVAGPTIPMDSGSGRTIIRPVSGGEAPTSGKKIVGLLVTYSVNPNGQVFNILEGKNFIGRDMPVDICIPDREMSGKHLSILYRGADGKFKFKDEQSSNGTFLNGVLTDEGELSTFDVIKIGATQLVFIAIPQLSQTN